MTSWELCEPLTPQEWTYPGERQQVLNDQHLLSAYHLDEVLHNRDDYATRTPAQPFREVDTAEIIFSYLFGIVASEPGHITAPGGVFHDYAKKLFTRINNSEDTGLVHSDIPLIWKTLSDVQKKSVKSLVLEATEKLDSFHNIGKMNVIHVNQSVHVDVGPLMMVMILPVVVETKKGTAGVIPFLSGLAGRRTHAVPATLNRIMSADSRTDITQIHCWDVAENKVMRPDISDLDNAVETISSMC